MSEPNTQSVLKLDMSGMKKANVPIPLRPALRVEMIQVIVCNILCQDLDLMLEWLSTESRCFRHVQRQTFQPEMFLAITAFQEQQPTDHSKVQWVYLLHRYHLTCSDLCGSSLHPRRCQEVDPPDLHPKHPSALLSNARFYCPFPQTRKSFAGSMCP